jgi:endoglucanase
MIELKSHIKVLSSLMIGVLALIGLNSCSSSDDSSDDNSSVVFKVPNNTLTFTNNGGNASFSVQAGSEPSVKSSASWCTVNIASKGTKVYTYNVSTTAYAGNKTDMTGYDDRTATITVTQGSNNATVTVTQTPEYGLFITSDKIVSVDAAGGNVVIKLKSNSGEFTVSSDADWATLPSSRTSLQEYSKTVTVASNISNARTAKVSFTLGTITESVTINQSAGQMSGDMSHSAKEIAKLMYPGWNLGNTMEAGNSANVNNNDGGLSAETFWQSTKTSQALIDYVKAQGFKSVRIPCSWIMGHITDATNYTIDDAWMNRVQEIVDYCIKDGLYVELNDHWDGGWLEQSFSDISDATVAKKTEILKKVWTQIANHFKNYDEHLMFGGLNEPGMNNLGAFGSASITALLKYEQAFIDAVRATGGNNSKRTLVVQGPDTNIDQTNSLFDVTRLTDSANGRLMVEVHFYDPWQFTGMEKDASWGKIWYYWGNGNDGDADRTATAYEESYVSSQMNKMKQKFVDNDIPVIIGEYGANYRFTGDDKHDASIKAYYKAVNQYAISNGCVPFAWDTNYIGYPSMTIINRAKLSIYNQHMLDGIKDGVNEAKWPY